MELAPHVQKNVFTSEVTSVPNRNGYGEGLKEAGEQNPDVVALSADLTESTRTHHFADAFPDRFVQVGISEQNMASVASGMAAMGKIPFIASYAVFSPGRSYEQVRTTIAYNEANVKIIGAHAGLSVGPDGATHQALEDMAIMRAMPNMIVLAPGDVHEARKAVHAMVAHVGPAYMRVAREKTPVLTTENSPFTIGVAETFLYPSASAPARVAIVSTGTMTYEALVAGKKLNDQGVGTEVVHMATVKPLDTECLDRLASEYELIVTVEEHQRAGGLGGAVSEYLSETNPTRILRIGVDDQFGQSGTMPELFAAYEIHSEAILKKISGYL